MQRREFLKKGFTIVPGVLSDAECDQLSLLARSYGDPGSRRLLKQDWCTDLAETVRSNPEVTTLIPADYVAVQCTYFEKSVSTNWLVTVHQDLSIPVEIRIDHPDLSGWSEKEGCLYVQPPIGLLQELVAIRLHLDMCGDDDGPLRVVPGSHLLGRISPETAPLVRADRGEVACPVRRGSAMAMRPLLLHASSKAKGASKRRVLHFLFGPRSLPYGLRWQDAA